MGSNVGGSIGSLYRDMSTEQFDVDSMQSASSSASASVLKDSTFPVRLHCLITEAEKDGKDDIIAWQPHGRSFAIKKPTEFVQELLPLWFSQKKLESFQRQLNIYGFARIQSGPDRGCYYHECFLRGMNFLSRRIARIDPKKQRPKKSQLPPAFRSFPNFYDMPYVPVARSGRPQEQPEGSSARSTNNPTSSAGAVPALTNRKRVGDTTSITGKRNKIVVFETASRKSTQACPPRLPARKTAASSSFLTRIALTNKASPLASPPKLGGPATASTKSFSVQRTTKPVSSTTVAVPMGGVPTPADGVAARQQLSPDSKKEEGNGTREDTNSTEGSAQGGNQQAPGSVGGCTLTSLADIALLHSGFAAAGRGVLAEENNPSTGHKTRESSRQQRVFTMAETACQKDVACGARVTPTMEQHFLTGFAAAAPSLPSCSQSAILPVVPEQEKHCPRFVARSDAAITGTTTAKPPPPSASLILALQKPLVDAPGVSHLPTPTRLPFHPMTAGLFTNTLLAMSEFMKHT